jgi:hypothetical protein
MKRLLITALLTAFISGTSFVTLAAEAPAEKAGETAKGKRPTGRPFRGTIKSFDKASQTLTLDGDQSPVILITSGTRLYKDGKQATTETLTVGEMVMGFGRDATEGKIEALTIRVGKPPARGPAPGEKGKGEEKKDK